MALRPGWIKCGTNQRPGCGGEGYRKSIDGSVLLDTTVIVDTLNGKKARYEFLDALLAQRNLLACCSINVTEVFAGVRPD